MYYLVEHFKVNDGYPLIVQVPEWADSDEARNFFVRKYLYERADKNIVSALYKRYFPNRLYVKQCLPRDDGRFSSNKESQDVYEDIEIQILFPNIILVEIEETESDEEIFDLIINTVLAYSEMLIELI